MTPYTLGQIFQSALFFKYMSNKDRKFVLFYIDPKTGKRNRRFFYAENDGYARSIAQNMCTKYGWDFKKAEILEVTKKKKDNDND